MLFDYLAEKHNVSWADLLTPLSFSALLMALGWTRGCFRGEVGWAGRAGKCTAATSQKEKSRNSFSEGGFVRLAQILRTFTFCCGLLRINTRDRGQSRKNAGGAIFTGMFGLLALPCHCAPPTPVSRWHARCSHCTATQLQFYWGRCSVPRGTGAVKHRKTSRPEKDSRPYI